MEDFNKKLDRLNDQSSITTGFKLQCLNTTLKFIKDDKQFIKEFPNLTPPQAELITTLVCNPNINSDIGFGYKSFYAPLWEAMKIFGLKYKFQIREKDGAVGTKTLIFEKIAKNLKKENNDINPTTMDTSESETSFQSNASISSKKIRKSDVIIKSLSIQFVTKSLAKITSFYKDDSMASVTFNGLNSNEYFFYHNIKNIMASKRMRSAFDKSVRILFEKMMELAKSKDNFKLSIKKAKMCDTNDTAITYTKLPVFKKHSWWVDEIDRKENTASNKSSDRSVSRETGNIKISINPKGNAINGETDSISSAAETKSVNSLKLHASKPVSNVTRRSLLINSVVKDRDTLPSTYVNGTQNFISNVKGDTDSVIETLVISVNNHKARDRIKESVALPSKNIPVNKSTNKRQDIRSDQSTDRSISKDGRANGICFQAGGVLDRHIVETIDTPKTIDKADTTHRRRAQTGVELNNRKIKLLEAMSMPIKSDKGLRMMRGMGWEGGALGLRGEGIIEPIIPALERVSYAGLGHIATPKPVKLRPRKPAEFRTELLQAIIQLLSNNINHKVLTYHPVLVKKEKNFCKQIIGSYNARSKIELAAAELVLSNNIVLLLKSHPTVIVRGCVSPCMSQIRLSKDEKNSIPNMNTTTRDVIIINRLAKIEEKLKRALPGDLTGMVATLEQDCQTQKLYDLLEFRIEILIYLLEFFKAEELKMTWCSRNILNRKKIRFIDYAIESIDLKARFGSTEPEIALVKEILRFSGDYGLQYTFFNQFSSFTVTKIYKPKKNNSNVHKTGINHNNNYDTVNKNNISAKLFKNTETTASIKSDIDNTDSMDLYSQSEATEEPASSSDDVIIIKGKESPIIISDDENYLLGSPKSNWDDDDETENVDNETKQTMAYENVDYKTTNMDNENTMEYETGNVDNKTENTMDYKTDKIVDFETTNVSKDKIVHYETGNVGKKIENTMDYETDKTVDYKTKNVDEEIKRTMDHETDKTVNYETRNVGNGPDKSVDYDTKNVDKDIEMTMDYNTNKTVDDESRNVVYEILMSVEYEIEKTVPDLGLSEKCDNLDFNLMELEKAIKDADDIKESSSPLTKRSRSDSATSDIKIPKISRLEIKKVRIVHSNYPIDRLNKINIENLQEVISCNILKSKDLPLLKCHGVQEGALIYSCHTEKSYEWLKNTICGIIDVKILETKEVIEDGYKMSLKYNCYFDFDADYLFEMLELYNKDLSTGKWIVLQHNVFMDHVCFVVKMDVSSYYYVRESGYSLYAGVDEVQFSIIWD